MTLFGEGSEQLQLGWLVGWLVGWLFIGLFALSSVLLLLLLTSGASLQKLQRRSNIGQTTPK